MSRAPVNARNALEENLYILNNTDVEVPARLLCDVASALTPVRPLGAYRIDIDGSATAPTGAPTTGRDPGSEAETCEVSNIGPAGLAE